MSTYNIALQYNNDDDGNEGDEGDGDDCNGNDGDDDDLYNYLSFCRRFSNLKPIDMSAGRGSHHSKPAADSTSHS